MNNLRRLRVQKELERSNLHFATRHIYSVDVLDYTLSRSRNREWAEVDRRKAIADQILPPHLKHSQAYLDKYFPED